MNPNSPVRPLVRVLPLIGIAFVVFAFLVLLPAPLRTRTAWLDLVVLSALLIMNFPTVLLWGFTTTSFDAAVPKFAMLMYLRMIVTPLSLGMMAYGWFTLVPFKYQLVYQVGMALLVLLGSAIATYSSDHIAALGDDEAMTASQLIGVREALLSCEAALREAGSDWSTELATVAGLKDKVRYLSPSRSSNALTLERRLYDGLQNVCAAMRSPSSSAATRDQVRATLRDCTLALSSRQQV